MCLLATFKAVGLLNYRPFHYEKARQCNYYLFQFIFLIVCVCVCLGLPVTCLLIAMIYTGSKGIQYLPISIFTIFKNISIIFIALGDVRYFNGNLTPMMICSFLLIIASSILGGFSDLQFNLRGYLWMFSNCATSAAFILYMRAIIKKVGFMDFDTVFYNNLLAVPLLLVCSLLTEAWSFSGLNPFSVNHIALFWAIGISSLATFLISFGSAWSIRVSSSTTYRFCFVQVCQYLLTCFYLVWLEP